MAPTGVRRQSTGERGGRGMKVVQTFLGFVKTMAVEEGTGEPAKVINDGIVFSDETLSSIAWREAWV